MADKASITLDMTIDRIFAVDGELNPGPGYSFRQTTPAVEVVNARPTMSVRTRKARKGDRQNIVGSDLRAPIVVTEEISGVSVPKIARTSWWQQEFSFPPLSTTAERLDVCQQALAFLTLVCTADSMLYKVFVNQEALS